ncbi:MAG: hypothetical protein KDC38_21350, partial [Planctomycetes bacterium]|nr:hypothetical protein [Planctomycetota bacterium]
SGDERLLESLKRSFEFIAHFMHPDRSIGGEYTSRNTQTYYPAAFEMMAGQCPVASWIAETMRPAVRTLSAAGLGTVDIYNLFPLLNNTVFAYLGATAHRHDALPPRGPSESPGVVHFPDAGLLKVRRERYDLYVGVHKGGVVKLFDRQEERLAFSNCGYIGRLANGKTFSNQIDVKDRSAEITEDSILVEGQFFQASRPVMDPWRFMAFRLFSLTFGRFKSAAYWLKSLLVKVLIYKKREIDVRFRRRITLHDDGIEIADHVEGDPTGIESLEPGDVFTTIHMGSSRYFVPHELISPPDDGFQRPIALADLRTGVDRTIRVRLSPEARD